MRTLSPGSPLTPLLEFTRNPLRAGRELRDALHADSRGFLVALANQEGFEPDDRGFRYAMILLLHNDVLIPSIANPAVTTLPEALRLTRCMLKMDCNFINSMLTTVLIRPGLMKNTTCTLRVLDIVGECVEHLGNWRSITRIHQAGDGQIKKKCAGLIAQHRFEDPAGLERFCCADPRVRANIIEMLWTVDKTRATALLEAASQDPSNRVAGNAWLALYTAGNANALDRLADMLESPDATKRITAAWAMGQTRDTRFRSRLLEASRSNVPEFRKMAIAALVKLDPPPRQDSEKDLLRPEETDVAFVSAPLSESYELWLHVTGPGARFLTGIRPVDFFVWREETLLLAYSVEERSNIHNAAIAIVYPAESTRFVAALKASIGSKAEGHCWALNAYGGTVPAGVSGDAARFESNAGVLTRLMDSGPATSINAEEAVTNILSHDPKLPERHLVLILDGWGPDPDAETVQRLCRERGFQLHCQRLQELKFDDLTELPKTGAGCGEETEVERSEAHSITDASGDIQRIARQPGEVDDDAPVAGAETRVMEKGDAAEEAVVTQPERKGLFGVIQDEEESAALWPRFVAALSSRYVLRTQQMPTSVAVRDPKGSPIRFTPRRPLPAGVAKGDRNG
jgi:hypothetical protein